MKSFQEVADEYNDKIEYLKRIHCEEDVTVDDVFNSFKYAKTSFGSPRLATVTFVKGKTIVIGPNMLGAYLIVYKNDSDFYVSVQKEKSFIKEDNKENGSASVKRDLNELYDNDPEKWLEEVFYSIDIYALYNKVSAYVEAFIKDKNTKYKDYKYISGRFYKIEQKLDYKDDDYVMTDFNDNIVYDIVGCSSNRSFRIYDHLLGSELFRVIKKWKLYYNAYIFYRKEEMYGTFTRESSFIKPEFVLDSLDGEVTMRKSSLNGGVYYMVRVKDELVGIIAMHLDTLIERPDLDICILQVKNERYRHVVAALATMIAISNDEN